MHHSFNVFLAQKYSVDEAIFLEHIYYWYLHNKSNNKNFFDNRFWTYNSISAFAEQFIYLSEKQIRNILLKLETKGLIITGNYNKISYDRTKWYSITEIGLNILEDLGIHKEYEKKSKAISKKEISILPNENIHFTEQANGITEKGEPIPLLNSDLKQIETNNIKNKEMNKTNELVLQNQSLINNQFDGILDLSVRYNCKDIEIETQLNEILKSEKMNAVKKLYNKVARNNLFKGKTYDNILNWHKNNLKINCLTSIWLYDYEVIKLRMKYNADYLLKIIYEIDRYLQDPTKFSKYTDQYKFIENWIKRDIGHILTIKTHIRVDMYDYVNYGVDYDLFK